jgi:energy-coupling factor transport system ATP-binding protein
MGDKMSGGCTNRDPVIDVQGLEVGYPETQALRGIDLTIAPGSFVLVGGTSGSGKSTLAHTLMGLIPQTMPAEVSGHIRVAGLDPRKDGTAHLARQVGLVFQNPVTQLFNGTVREEAAFGPRNLGLPKEEIARRVNWALEKTGCTHLSGRAVRHLSGGEQQRVAIAANLAMRPRLLLLDEPTANLDTEGVRAVVGTLAQLHRRAQVTIVVIEHRLEPFLPHAERLIWLEDGSIIADGLPVETLAQMEPKLPPSAPPPTSNGEVLVKLDGVTAGYNGHSVLRKCSLNLRRGEFMALIGSNGAGKTTLARVLAGLLRPKRGRVVWHTNGRKQRFGLLQQNPLHQLVCDTVGEEVSFGPRNLGQEHMKGVEEVLAQTDLLALRHRSTQALSVGQQQRTAMAATLALRPTLLILDEPTIGQDRRHLHRMMEFVRSLHRAGQTVLLITHDHKLVKRYAGKVMEMKAGKIAEVEV